jgi:hypothetical protein
MLTSSAASSSRFWPWARQCHIYTSLFFFHPYYTPSVFLLLLLRLLLFSLLSSPCLIYDVPTKFWNTHQTTRKLITISPAAGSDGYVGYKLRDDWLWADYWAAAVCGVSFSHFALLFFDDGTLSFLRVLFHTMAGFPAHPIYPLHPLPFSRFSFVLVWLGHLSRRSSFPPVCLVFSCFAFFLLCLVGHLSTKKSVCFLFCFCLFTLLVFSLFFVLRHFLYTTCPLWLYFGGCICPPSRPARFRQQLLKQRDTIESCVANSCPDTTYSDTVSFLLVRRAPNYISGPKPP